MATYILNLTQGGQLEEILARDDAAAIAHVAKRHPDWIAADQWDADGWNADGEACKRLLFWESEQIAENDDGGYAVASLSTIGAA